MVRDHPGSQKNVFARVVEWQTRTFEGRMEQSVRVQVPPRAQNFLNLTNMKIKYFICFFVFTSLMFSDVIKRNSFSGFSNGNEIVLRWITENENNVSKFIIERRINQNENFISIGELNAYHTPSQYEFIDYSALFKSSAEILYQYRIKIIFTNSSSQYSEIISVSHSVSGVKKTWGSIKAMFR